MPHAPAIHAPGIFSVSLGVSRSSPTSINPSQALTALFCNSPPLPALFSLTLLQLWEPRGLSQALAI